MKILTICQIKSDTLRTVVSLISFYRLHVTYDSPVYSFVFSHEVKNDWLLLFPFFIVFPNLQRKTRVFILKGGKMPIRHMISVKHTSSKPLTYFDGSINRALRYATNQISPFVDEQDGVATLEPIIFENGKLIEVSHND